MPDSNTDTSLAETQFERIDSVPKGETEILRRRFPPPSDAAEKAWLESQRFSCDI